MRKKFISPLIVALLLVGTLYFAASGRSYISYADLDAAMFMPADDRNTGERRMVDMIADDSYLIDQGDSTIFILVGNFAAHHNGTVILADSAVRYSNQSFECFGNVLINQNTTYAYGDRAEYNHDNGKARIYSELVKVVDGDAVMYTYNCIFDTAAEMGEFYGGCYVDKADSHMESERGYYNTETHDLIAVKNVEMRDDSYLMVGDSVIFNTNTEDAHYFSNTNIWNDKDEYLFANEGFYIKSRDLHHLVRDAYILTPEREIWSDSIEYYRTDNHIIGRGNIQMDDTTQKVLGFADYGEWWDEPGNALFTRRPSMINYDPMQPDSLFLSGDTLWMYTIEVGRIAAERAAQQEASMMEQRDTVASESSDVAAEEHHDETAGEAVSGEATINSSSDMFERGDKEQDNRAQMPEERGARERERHAEVQEDASNNAGHARRTTSPVDTLTAEETVAEGVVDTLMRDTLVVDTLAVDTLAVDTLATDSIKPLTKRQIRYRAKLERRRLRDSVKSAERRVRDSVDSLERRVRDSIQLIKDSLLKIEVDSIIAKRIERSSRLADEEKARIARVKERAEMRRRHKIDKAKARALRRGKEYKGEEYTIDSAVVDSALVEREPKDSIVADSTLIDTAAMDSLAIDSLAARVEPQIPIDSTYKMIKAYRRVKMYRSDSQMVCDSLVLLNTDSIVRLYIDPLLWNEGNQVSSDSMAIYTRHEKLVKAHFMGDPMLGAEIDTMYYNQVKGKDMTAYFNEGQLYRNDVDGNAQTIYYMQEEESPEVTGMMYIESAAISFYLVDGEMDKIVYKQQPEYVLYPLAMIPEDQKLKLPDFEWHYDRRPTRDSVCDREIRPTRREDNIEHRKPRFRITERIDYDRRRLVENSMWVDRLDELTPDVIEWRNSRASYNQ